MNVDRAWWGLECSDDILKLLEDGGGQGDSQPVAACTGGRVWSEEERDVEEEMMRWY